MNVTRRRWWALGGVSLSVLAVGLDGTVLSIALPTLAGALHATESELEWFSSGYLLMLAAFVLPAGMLGDRFGRKKVLLVSLAVFGAGSVLCAFSTTPLVFLAARLLMGVAGSGLTVMALSALTVLFDERERPRAVGVFSAANFLALPLGPLLGGWMLSHLWWGWVFLLNAPVVVIGLIAVALLVPDSRSEMKRSVDVAGMALSTVGLVVMTYGLVEAGEHGWTDVAALAEMAAGVVVLVGFGLWEAALARRGGSPLVDTELFRSRAFTWGAVLAGVAGIGMIGLLFVMPQFFQAVQGDSTFGSGLRLLPFVGGMLVGAVPAGFLVARLGFRLTVSGGFALIAIGSIMGSRTVPTSGEAFIAAWMAIVCAGAGLALSASTSAALARLTPERSGVGSGVVQAIQKTGAPLGTAVVGSVVAAVYGSSLNPSSVPVAAVSAARKSVYAGIELAAQLRSSVLADEVRVAFAHGMSVSLVVGACIAVIGAIMAVVLLPTGANSTAKHVAEHVGADHVGAEHVDAEQAAPDHAARHAAAKRTIEETVHAENARS
jgi:DHA2 family multidrug resistance protein-like MFS transporter